MPGLLRSTAFPGLAVASVALGAGTSPAADSPKRLDRLYLVVHALNWLELVPGDPRRETPEWELWPGRCDLCYRYEQPLKERYYELLGTPDPDAGVCFLPSGMAGDPPLIEHARATFGDRCVVCRANGDPEADRQLLGEEFVRGLEADRRRAERVRGPDLAPGEIAAWERSKAWATDLQLQLEAHGYTFDPQRVEVIALGEDWCGCAATYPIHMGRAWKLRHPIERRFDLMNPDCSPLLLGSSPLEQNIPMPGDVRLFIYRSAEGRLLAQYWEGVHGLFDRPRVAVARFPEGTVRRVDVFGRPRDDAPVGTVALSVGCGGHTPYGADLVQAEPDLPLTDFRRTLLAASIRAR